MVELYFAIKVWALVILVTLCGILTLIYVVWKLNDYFVWKRINKKQDTTNKHP